MVDFYCAAARLAIEIDGAAHDMGDQPQRDIDRDTKISQRGIDIIRIPASDVLKSVNEVAEGLASFCRERIT